MLVYLLSCLLLFVLARVAWARWKYDMHKIPSMPEWPLVGHGLHFVNGKTKNEITRVRARFFKELGYPKIMKASYASSTGKRYAIPVLQLNLFGKIYLEIVDVHTAKSLILKSSDIPRTDLLPLFSILLGNDLTTKVMLVTQNLTPYVKKIRRIYASAFLGSHLKRMVPKLNSALDKMLEIIESHRKTGPIDLQRLCIRLTLDAIGIVAFETNLGGLDESSNLCQLLNEAAYIAGNRLINPFKKLKCKLFPKSAEAQRDNAIIDALTAEWVRLTRDILSRDDPCDGETPLWFGLKQLADPSAAEPLGFKKLMGEVATVVSAGMDTTGHQLCWALALLASYSDAMQTLLEEFKGRGLYGEAATRVSYEDLGDMPYLTAVVKESMRMASVVTGAMREAPCDMKILGYRIPKGTYLSLPSNRWLDAKDEWGDPEVFRPERWLAEEDISQRYYLGFSCGPRDCAGQKLAMLEMRVALIRLLGAYHFSLTVPFDKLMDDSQNGIAIRVENGVWFHLTPRNQVTTQ